MWNSPSAKTHDGRNSSKCHVLGGLGLPFALVGGWQPYPACSSYLPVLLTMLHPLRHLSAHLLETLSTGSHFGGSQMGLSAAIPHAFLVMVKQTRDIPKWKPLLDSKNAETFPRTQLAPLHPPKSSTMLQNPPKLVRNPSTLETMEVIGSCWLESQYNRLENHLFM